MLSATDPIYMIQLIQILGDDFVVWDKAAAIKYKRPAKETIYAEFIFSEEEIAIIKSNVEANNEIDIEKMLVIKSDDQTVYALVTKTLYIAKKAFYKEKLKKRKSN